ncbi:MAG TPA: GlsB/YeaQ/YmgE family stress response membrane protein [Chloroflexia bacterium]|nr:GlsB/YeaQ/YmgE family stress response membrane protein [Chloroflexia bacterium]
MILTILSWIIIGFIAGWLASNIAGIGEFGLMGDIVVGLVGAVIGGVIISLLTGRGLNDAPLDIGNFILNVIVAVIGAIILIALLRALPSSKRTV